MISTGEREGSMKEPHRKLLRFVDGRSVEGRLEVSTLGPEGRASALTGVFFLLPAGRLARFAGYPR